MITETPIREIVGWTLDQWYNNKLTREQVDDLLKIVTDNSDNGMIQNAIEFLKTVI